MIAYHQYRNLTAVVTFPVKFEARHPQKKNKKKEMETRSGEQH